MIKVLLILLYLFNGEVKLEQSAHANLEVCDKTGSARIAELEDDPRFEGLFTAGCVPLLPKQTTYHQANK